FASALMLLLATVATTAAAQGTGYGAEGMLCERPSGLATGVRARTPQGPTLSVGVDHEVGAMPVFALADVGAAGAGASLGLLAGMIGCTSWGDMPLFGLSLRGSAIRTYGSPKGSRVEPAQTYVGGELTLHLLLSVGVGVFSRVAGPARNGRLVTLALGAGF
ncbi:MAG TPA: hypothetical protein VFN39_01730, partial [Gemmatimonadaceae bacterium]|nr:hypothetical protein [Gemmatimonadaceae bacterium]